MAVKTDIGGRVQPYALAAATIPYTPQMDRAGLIRRMLVLNPSASDTWRLTVGGREIMAFRNLTVGFQTMLEAPLRAAQWHQNFFDYVRHELGIDPSVPVPQGLTATLASDGGATADLLLEVEEHDPTDISANMINHYRGTRFIVPAFFSLAASQTVAGRFSCDTQVAPRWIPTIIGRTPVPVDWSIKILALFLEGAGVNTFSGAANHASVTQETDFVRNGEFLFSHTVPGGMLNEGSASAAGSANTVFGHRSGLFSAFQETGVEIEEFFTPPIQLKGGDNLDVQLQLTGDLTGGASYANVLQAAVLDLTVPTAA